jgi:hypothetical protein
MGDYCKRRRLVRQAAEKNRKATLYLVVSYDDRSAIGIVLACHVHYQDATPIDQKERVVCSCSTMASPGLVAALPKERTTLFRTSLSRLDPIPPGLILGHVLPPARGPFLFKEKCGC